MITTENCCTVIFFKIRRIILERLAQDTPHSNHEPFSEPTTSNNVDAPSLTLPYYMSLLSAILFRCMNHDLRIWDPRWSQSGNKVLSCGWLSLSLVTFFFFNLTSFRHPDVDQDVVAKSNDPILTRSRKYRCLLSNEGSKSKKLSEKRNTQIK